MGKRGGEKGGDAPPLRVKNKSPPPLYKKNGYPSQKILDLFYFIPPCLAFLLFFLQTEKLQQLAKD